MGGAIASQSLDRCGDPSGAPETSQNGRGRGLQGERDRGSTMTDRPLDDGPGNRLLRPSDATRMPLDNWSTSRADRHTKLQAAAGPGA